MPEISPQTQKLIQKYQAWSQSIQPKEGIATIHVDEIASRVASFYEKIRGVIDWREEHLLRKTAIERALKRRLLWQKTGRETAEPLILELIRGGHFPNDRIEEIKIEEVKRVLDKYIYILENSDSPPKVKLKIQLYDWLLEIGACEIEEILSPPLREIALIEYMTELMKERIEVTEKRLIGKKMLEEEKNTQIYIAVQRALFKLDKSLISYQLLKKRYPEWQNFPHPPSSAKPSEGENETKFQQPQLKEIATNIYSIWEEIEDALSHPLAEKFYLICEKYDTPYLILGDILSKNPQLAPKNLSQPEVLENLIKESYQERLSKLEARLKRAALYSTISIFFTKMLLAFGIEIPFDKYVLNQFDYQVLTINILVPPLLMLFLVLTIRPPKKENLNRIIMKIMKIVYQTDKKDIYEIKLPRKRGFFLNSLIVIFYLLTFLISFGIIIWGLNKLNFSFLSIIIFLMFFCLISFAGVKIRERAKELQVLPGKPGIFAFLIDSFSLPFIRMGKWLSAQLAKYNLVLVLITILIDLPFQLLTEFLEHWITFLKEKKEEIH